MSEPGVHAIGDLRDYVAVTTYNALDDLRTRHDPLRGRLAARLRYAFKSSSSLALWGEPMLCGLSRWGKRSRAVPIVMPRDIRGAIVEDAELLRAAVEDALTASGGPLRFASLVEAFAAWMGISGNAFVGIEALENVGEPPDALRRLLRRERLELLWHEIAILPVRERQALLLHLRLEDGESAAAVLTDLGIASRAAFSEAVDVPLPELDDLWNDLPLPDDRIALRLGVIRQKVINLRKSARERLERRMRRHGATR